MKLILIIFKQLIMKLELNYNFNYTNLLIPYQTVKSSFNTSFSTLSLVIIRNKLQLKEVY